MTRLLACLAVTLLVACTRASIVGYVQSDQPSDPFAPAATDDGGVDGGLPERADFVDECVAAPNTALSDAAVEALRGPSEADGRWLYPYDQAVMPRGAGAPELMWDGVDAEAVLVNVRTRGLEYQTCLVPSSPHNAQLSEETWSRIERSSAGRNDVLTMQVTMTSGRRVVSLPTRTLVVASERLPGALYYMAYSSRLAPATASGAIFRFALGQSARIAVAPLSCSGCHGVSADGSRMLAYANGFGATYALSDASVNQLPYPSPNAELAALSPDGRFYISGARALGLGPRSFGPISSLVGTLYEAETGLAVLDSGVAAGALMPAFAAEGDALVFTDAALDGKGIAVMRFDSKARRASDYRVLVQDQARFPGWPTFVPGKSAVVFALGERGDYSGNGARLLPVAAAGPRSDIHAVLVDAASPTPVLLYRAMGFATAADAAAERTQLPFGAEDLHQNYNPQVAPVSAGGFHWVFFDSIRHYGNRGVRRQIWCAAIDADDPTTSHPPFYVRGQELEVGTFRPVFARDPG